MRNEANMTIPTIYRVINKSDNVVRHFRKSYDIGVFMLGKRYKNYIFIKSDANGDRLVTFDDCDVFAVERKLDQA